MSTTREAKKEVCEADNGAAPFVAVPPYGLGEGVIGPMRKGIAVDDQERPAQEDFA